MLRLLAGFLLLLPALFAAGRELVIFDTDSCAFCDDGAALVMLLRSPEQVNVLGITVVPGNVWPVQGAEYMFHILDLLRRPQIPVYTGAMTPLINTSAMAHEFARRWPGVEYSGAFALSPTEVKAAPGAKLTHRVARAEAVEYLIGEIERHPGEVTILALGPMTNIALALRMKPAIETKIKRIVFMGGNLKVGGNASTSAEFNFWFDPEAARIVLRSRIPQKIMFGLDICNTAPLHKAEFDQIVSVQTPITELYKEELGNRYPGFLSHPNATGYMWDSLAAAYLLDPGFVTRSESHYLDVLTVWNKYYGATVPLDRDRRIAPDATPVTVAMELDFKRIFALYKEKLTKRE
ncbi:MAG TPA: nucleoside hydrolase [Candidatus Sulfopaludibacter sp.]|jgi:inosine-uridine nucleoside N-ribohydrolase|nr:nucleoside hydrolase [Candidatus Sulfopaludibacter sp.]